MAVVFILFCFLFLLLFFSAFFKRHFWELYSNSQHQKVVSHYIFKENGT